MKFVAVYVTYGPDMAYLERSLAAVRDQVDGIVIADNGGGPDDALAARLSAEVIRMNGNEGIASALNAACTRAVEMGADWILSFDQDSLPPSGMVRRYEEIIAANPGLGQLGCRYSGSEEFVGTRSADSVITSGAALSVPAFRQAGPYRGDYFIDMVDIEYSWRLRRCGWKVMQTSDVVLEHHLGDGLGGISLFGKKRLCYMRHTPSRWYYIVRNTMTLCREYGKVFPEECGAVRSHLKRSLCRALVMDSQRRAILYAARSGCRDASVDRLGKAEIPFTVE